MPSTKPERLMLFNWAEARPLLAVKPEAGARADAAVRKADARLRPSLLPGLLEALARNENNGNLGAKLYEIGSAFWTDAGGQIIERPRVGLVGSPNMREVRGTVEAVLSRLNGDVEIRVVPDGKTGFGQGACGRIEWGGRVVGWLGKIERAIADRLSLREVPAAAARDAGLTKSL